MKETTHDEDMAVRKRVYGILAWHVNRTHANLSDHDLCARVLSRVWQAPRSCPGRP